MIADENGEFDWIAGEKENYDGDYGYQDFIKTADTIFMGRTYQQIVTEFSLQE